jgi:hypothetical protein
MKDATIETPSLAKKEIGFELFSQNMRTFRQYKGISSKQASIDASLKLKSRWECLEYGRGTPSMLEFHLICKYLGQSMDSMLNKVATIEITFKEPV